LFVQSFGCDQELDWCSVAKPGWRTSTKLQEATDALDKVSGMAGKLSVAQKTGLALIAAALPATFFNHWSCVGMRAASSAADVVRLHLHRRLHYSHITAAPASLAVSGRSADNDVDRIRQPDPSGDIYLLDLWRAQTNTLEWIETLFSLVAKYKDRLAMIEITI
jgi:hypothetical protein